MNLPQGTLALHEFSKCLVDFHGGRDRVRSVDSSNTMFRAVLVSLVITFPLGLGSCGSGGAVNKSGTAAGGKKPEFFISSLFPAPVKIVKVRQKDLKELPLGHERALAFDRERRFGFWSFGGVVDFKQPDLPQPGAEMDGSLLPPKTP